MSTLQVENLIGPTSGSNANKVIIPSGQTLDASNGFVAPTGHVIQTQYATILGDLTTASTTPISSGLSKAFTPKYANSIIRLSVMGGRIYINSAGKQMDIYLYVDGVSGATVFGNGYGRLTSIYDNTSGSIHPSTNSCVAYVPATNTNLRTYQIYFRGSSGSGTVSINQGPDVRVYFSVEEIAQ